MFRHPAGPAGLVLSFLLPLLQHPAPARADGFPGYGGITQDTTWSGTVVVIGDVIVQPQAQLTLAPGTHVFFDALASAFDHADGTPGRCDLIVQGKLAAVGGPGAADSIYFVSNAPAPAPGDWGTVRFDTTSVDDSCHIKNAVVRHATRGVYLTSAGPTIENSVFSECATAALEGIDVPSACHVARIVVRDNPLYGLHFTNFTGSILKSRFTNSGRIYGVWLRLGNGRFAENVVEGHTVTSAIGLFLDGNRAVVALDTLRNNRGVAASVTALRLTGASDASVESCLVSGNDVGVQVSGSAPSIAHSTFAGNGIAVDCQANGVPAIGDSTAAACDFAGNALSVRNLRGNGSFVRARWNYWGTTDEDSIFARLDGGVDVSPWTDAAHAAAIRAASYGVLGGNATWSGTVTIRGDLVVPAGVTLIVAAGTTLRFVAGYAVWDTLAERPGLTGGRCDLIVENAAILSLNGAPPDSVRLTSGATAPAPGDWGSLYFDTGASGAVTAVAVEYGTNGLVAHGAPSVALSSFRRALGDGVRVSGASLTLQTSFVEANARGVYLENGGSATVQYCTIRNNAGEGIYVYNAAPTIAHNTVTGNDIGVRLVAAGPVLSDNAITGNASYGVTGDAAGGARVGTSGHPNAIYGNGTAEVANLSSTDILPASFNYWGAVAEDSIAARLVGSVGYSPWYNAATTTTYAAMSYGTLTNDIAWSGAMWLRGDLIVPVGVTLRIRPGTLVRAWSHRTALDDPAGDPLRPDIIVYGRLVVGDVAGGRTIVTSDAALPAAGDWGRIRLLTSPPAPDSISNTTVGASSGIVIMNGSPRLVGDSLVAAPETTLTATASSFYGSNVAIGVAPGAVGVALNASSPVLGGWSVAGGGRVGVACVAGSSPIADGLTVTGPDSALTIDGVSSAYVGHAALSGKGVALLVRGGARPRVERSVFTPAQPAAGNACGVLLVGAGTRPDLGLGPLGSVGENVVKGYGGARFALRADVAATDTIYAKNAYWGTPDTSAVGALIRDHSDDPAAGVVLWRPALTTDVAAPVWSAHAVRDGGVVLAFRGAPRSEVEIWRAALAANGSAGEPAWPADFERIGVAVTDQSGAGRYADTDAEAGRGYAYAIARADPDGGPPVLLARIDVAADVGPRLAVAGPGRGAFPEVALELGRATRVDAAIVDARGRLVRRLAARSMDPGRHVLVAPAGSADAFRPAAGVYVVVVRTPEGGATARAIVLK